MLPLDALELLSDETHRLFPGRFAERAVPTRRSSHPIAHIVLAQHRETGLWRLAHASVGRPWLLAFARFLHRAPRPLAVAGPFAPPRPGPVLVNPTLPDERPGQAVPVLGEVVAEAPLHAGRALVRGVLLDPGRSDPEEMLVFDVEVDLATDAAVGADRAGDFVGLANGIGAEPLLGNELEDRAGGTHPDALAAPG